MERFLTGERGPQVRLAGDVGDVAVGLDRIRLSVDTEDLGTAAGRAQQAEEQTDRGRLPGAVRAEVSEHFPARDRQVEVDQRIGRPEPLRQPLGADRYIRRRRYHLVHARPPGYARHSASS